jgi:serine/threonine-protein kinase
MATEYLPANHRGRGPSSTRLRGDRALSLVGCFPGDPLQLPALEPGAREPLDPALPPDAFALPAQAVAAAPARSDGSSVWKPTSDTGVHARPSPLDLKPRLPQLGAVIDKYQIDAVLGSGGFAMVYRATHLLLRIPVAIKLLKPEVILAHPAEAERLCEEARFAAQINHPNVARVYDVTHTKRITYIVMEYIDGVSLHEAINRDQPLPAREVVRIGIDVIQGLKAALAQGMIHRDIKPANILLTRKGVAKIVDLGLAQSSSAEARGISAKPAEVVGTPTYMAPEQALSPEMVDHRSDIYSLGVTLYHAATGRVPFQGEDSIQTISMHLNQPVPSPRQHNQHFPAELERTLMWMLAKDINARPQTYDQLIEALRDTDQVLSLETAEPGKPSRGGLIDRIRGLFGGAGKSPARPAAPSPPNPPAKELP